MDLIKFQQNCYSFDAWNLLVPIIEKHFNDLIELTKQQLSEGETALGNMPDYASEVYADLKDKYVPTYKIYPTVDLRVTGDFYKGMKARIVALGIEIESIDKKALALEAKYGSKIYVLNDKNLTKFIDLIIDEYIETIYNYLAKE